MASENDDATRDWPGEPTTGRAGHAIEIGTGSEVGRVVDGRYRVRRVIGAGGMGTVAEVEGLADGRLYALKWCHVQGAGLKRFAREVRLMGQVRHRNVMPILASNLEASVPYFVMPLAESSLADELPRLAGSEAEALAVFHQACLGVQAIHGSGIVHRDIKPANILRFKSGRVAVSDLGVAKLAARDTTALTQTRAVVGTLAFLAPEQFLPDGSRRADVRTDVYQLGKVLYQLVTGRSPVMIEPGAVPKGLAHVLQRATSADPDDRYRDIGEFLDALRYYELSKDPARNSREALENLVLQAEALLRNREYRAENVREILALLAPLDQLDPVAAIERFDRLPDGLLPVMAAEFAAEFLPVLLAFTDALPSRVGTFRFAYADGLAHRMRRVFFAARHARLKAVALQATLIAAVALNRFAAMDAFNRLLMSGHRVEDALPVAEMLRAEAHYYAELAHGAPPGRLHPAIRHVQQDLLATEEVMY
jgi:eukaryotic-like serine/threonine-protein kinase